MDNNKFIDVLNLIRDKADNNKLIIFVGSGVSRNIEGMSSWYGIIDQMATFLNYSKCSYCHYQETNCESLCRLKKEYSTDEFLKIPQYLYNQNPEKYWEILNQCIVEPVDAPLSSAIFEINPAHIVTTNYDNLLEASTHVYREQFDVIIEDKDLLNSIKSKYIIKMHGDLKYPNSIVLKEQDYLDYSQNHILVELFIKSLLTNNTFLFLGYSLNDYNIKLIISWLNYMRSENSVFSKDQKIGYIVFNKPIDSMQLSYFENNNIGVIDISNVPMVDIIPDSIKKDIGKRLYSFLHIIANPQLDAILFSDVFLRRTVEKIKKYKYINYKSLLKILQMKRYSFSNSILKIYNNIDFERMKKALDSNDDISKELHRLLLNAGIESILNASKTIFQERESVKVGLFSNCQLFIDECYELYLNNNYDTLNSVLNKMESNLLIKCFYFSIISGYDYAFTEMYNHIPNESNKEETITFLHNHACLEYLKTYRFDAICIERYINNLSYQYEKDIFSYYTKLYEGNYQEILTENNSLSKIINEEEQSRKGVSEDFYIIQNVAITWYCFFFYNHLFINRFSNIKTLLYPYIQSALISSSVIMENCDTLVIESQHNSPYELTKVDMDIITKFVSTKELYNIINKYKIYKLNISKEVGEHVVECFCNLSRSICKMKNLKSGFSIVSTLSNLALIINRMELSEESKIKLSHSIEDLFSCNTFVNYFFSIDCPDWRESLVSFSDFLDSFKLRPNVNLIGFLFSQECFFEYAVNVDFQKLRIVINKFVNEELIQTDIDRIIENEEDIDKKIIIFRLVYKSIADDKLKEKYITFLSANYSKLSTNALYDFVLNKWIVLTEDRIKYLMSEVINLSDIRNQNESNGIYSYPNHDEITLEQIIIFYLFDIINDLSPLRDLADQNSYISFLLDPENFDYSKIDFSNYMWLNFARIEKYMDYFILHKKAILPRLIERYKKGIITDDEIKLLFRYFIDDDDMLWRL